MAPTSVALDNVKFFKAISEMGLIDDRNLSRADVDLIFTKVKAKGERRISLGQFTTAMVMIGRKKLNKADGDDSEVLNQLLNNAAVPSALDGSASDRTETKRRKAGGGDIVSRLTDPKLYTGAHKERFDAETGKGKGLAGRDSVSKGAGGAGAYRGGAVTDLSQITRGNLSRGGTTVPLRGGSPARTASSTAASPPRASAPKRSASPKKGGSIFDRLTDASQYTGAHRHRFDSDGRGRGLAGRDSVAKSGGGAGVYRGGAVSDLSQIVTRR